MAVSAGAGSITSSGEALEGRRWEIIGQDYVLRAKAGEVWVIETVFQPGQLIPAHVHAVTEEVLVVLGGSLRVRLGSAWHAAGPGDARRPKRCASPSPSRTETTPVKIAAATV